MQLGTVIVSRCRVMLEILAVDELAELVTPLGLCLFSRPINSAGEWFVTSDVPKANPDPLLLFKSPATPKEGQTVNHLGYATHLHRWL